MDTQETTPERQATAIAAAQTHDTPLAAKQPVKVAVSPITGAVLEAKYQWKKGQSGNPAGRQSIGLSIVEWMNQMRGWTGEELAAVVNDPKSPTDKCIAARNLSDARSTKQSKAGVPIAGPEMDRILDRTIGKAMQTINVTHQDSEDTQNLRRMALDRLEQLLDGINGGELT